MTEVIQIGVGELSVGHNDARIKTGSIGSCAVISLYDEEARVGGLAHALLPSRGARREDPLDAKYADEAVSMLVAKIEQAGGERERLRAKLVGGAMMFQKLISGPGIGAENIAAARERLRELHIPVIGEDTGGGTGKIAELHLMNGLLEVNTQL